MEYLLSQTRRLLLNPVGLVLTLGAASIVAVLVPFAAARAGRAETTAAGPAFRQMTDAKLRALAPVRLAGLNRTGISVLATDGINVAATALDASYEADPRRLELHIVYSLDLKQVIGFGDAGTTTYDRKSASGYQRRWREAGAILFESLDRQSGAAVFGSVGDNFYVMARGQGGVSMNELRAAVGRLRAKALAAAKGGG